jgi:hypothetical protein
VLCPRSAPSTKRLIRSPENRAGIISRESNPTTRFYTTRVNRVALTVGGPLPVCPDQRTSSDRPDWSASCHQRTYALQYTGSLFDHLVSGSEQRRWNSEAERLRSLEIDDQLEFGWLLDRQEPGFAPFLLGRGPLRVNRVGLSMDQRRPRSTPVSRLFQSRSGLRVRTKVRSPAWPLPPPMEVSGGARQASL